MSTADVATVKLGASSLRVSSLGVGTWAWGDKPLWGYSVEPEFQATHVADAFLASVRRGLNFFDTAEVYGHGESERLLGWLARKWQGAGETPCVIASKFGLLPGRNGANALMPALDATLKRMALPSLDLYQIHWADSAMASIDDLMHAMVRAHRAGKIRAVGVSNFTADELVQAHRALANEGIPLATQQVHYSLLHRSPEVDGVLEACRTLDVTLLAYSPLEMGLLTGKYSAQHRPSGRRVDMPIFTEENLRRAQDVLACMRTISREHGNVPLVQVALNWLRAKPYVVAIPGAKNHAQAVDNADSLQWSLTENEVTLLDDVSHAWRV